MALSPNSMIGADSNCLSFVIDAFDGIEKPVDALAEQRIALARIFFYAGTFSTLPTVKAECDGITDPVRRAKHHSWMQTHFGTLPVRANPVAVLKRADSFEQYHPGAREGRDRTLLAEAEAAQLAVVLTFDFDFIAHLSGKSKVRLMKPLDCWQELGIARGSKPRVEPVYSNPLVGYDWWLW